MTTYAKLSSPLIYILFLTSSPPLMAQESINESSTEYSTESLQSTTHPAEADNSFITCDLDLENIEILLPYLPDICTEIYYNRNESDLYSLYLEEARIFAKFYKKLNDYELRNQPNGDKDELSKYPFEVKLRQDAYSKADVSQCLSPSNSSITDYLNCLRVKRLELMELVPSVEEK